MALPFWNSTGNQEFNYIHKSKDGIISQSKPKLNLSKFLLSISYILDYIPNKK